MTHTYTVTGMTCTGCQAKVQQLLSQIPGIQQVAIDLAKAEATLSMATHVPTEQLQAALKDYPKYQLSDQKASIPQPELKEEKKSWLTTYKPILLIGAYITGISLLVELVHNTFQWQSWMEHFMAGFFLTFSFFKLLNIEGFADSYAMYDVIAKKIRVWGFIYPFVELMLGIAYLTSFSPVYTNMVTFLIMSISMIGVLQSVLAKRKIKCACLGAVFDLPMSTITIIEDLAMIAMSGAMLLVML